MKKSFVMTTRNIPLLLLLFAISRPAVSEEFQFLTSVTGDSVGDEFYEIATGNGDINADGYEDVVVGAPWGSGGGLVKLFLGSARFDTIPDATIHEIDGSYYGGSSALIGDVNSDGYDDFLIGSPHSSTAFIENGRAYLYFGGAEIDTIADLTFSGSGAYHFLGNSVAGVGDVNNDGFDDWLISEGSLGTQWFVYLYFGSQNPDSISDLTFAKYWPYSLDFDGSQLGDINNDGFNDLIFFDPGDFVEIHLGQTQMDIIPDLQWFGNYAKPICGIGDVNNDGYCDWMIRHYQDLLVFFGSGRPDTTSDLVLTAEGQCDYFNSCAAGGDITGNGADDIILGGQDYEFPSHGLIVGYLGGVEMDEHYDYFYDSGIEDERLGQTVGLADIDGDSILEVLAGASQEYPGGVGAWGPGRVWFFTVPEVVLVPPRQVAPYQGPVLTLGPNPFNPTTTIRYGLPKDAYVKLAVFDILGRQVAVLVNGQRHAGVHEVSWDAGDLASGLYIYSIDAGDFTASGKMVLVK